MRDFTHAVRIEHEIHRFLDSRARHVFGDGDGDQQRPAENCERNGRERYELERGAMRWSAELCRRFALFRRHG